MIGTVPRDVHEADQRAVERPRRHPPEAVPTDPVPPSPLRPPAVRLGQDRKLPVRDLAPRSVGDAAEQERCRLPWPTQDANPCCDRLHRLLDARPARVDPVGDVGTEPGSPTRLRIDLTLPVAPPPRRSRLDSLPPWGVGTVQQEEVNGAEPLGLRKLIEVEGRKRGEQDRGEAALRQPGGRGQNTPRNPGAGSIGVGLAQDWQ